MGIFILLTMELSGNEQAFKVCNLTYLRNFAGGDEGFIRQMIELFFIQVPDELNNIRQHLTINNLSDVKNTAHKLKSSVALLGAESMASRLKQIEDLALAEAAAEGIMDLHCELVQINEEAVKELKAYLVGV